MPAFRENARGINSKNEREPPASFQNGIARRTLSRRSLMAGVAGTSLLALLAACGSDDDDTPEATAPTGDSTSQASDEEAAATGNWEFTDDRGVTISLPERPSRVVVYSTAGAALWDYGIRPIGIFGPQRNPDGTQNAQAGEIDLDAVTSIGEDTSALDLEQLVSLDADLIVGLTYDAETIWPLDAGVVSQMEEIAPIAGMSASGKSADVLMSRFEELAVALGADLTAGQVADDQERFGQAVADFESALAEKPDLTALFVAGSADALYIGNPNAAPDLLFFAEHGLSIAGPDSADYFEELSWEQATKYEVDLVLNDSRGSWYTQDQLAAEPTWQEHPAQKAGQIGEWLTVFALSPRGFAKVIEDLTATIEASRDDVVVSGSSGASGTTTAEDGPWEFTDARGVTVSLPSRPERIVAYSAAAGALWDFGIRPVGVFGPLTQADGSPDTQIGRLDVTTVETAGEDRQALDLEQLVLLKPDLVISTMNTLGQLWGLMEDGLEENVVSEVAPIIGIAAFDEPIDGLIGHVEALAIALGADPDSQEITAARDDFDTAAGELQAALAEKPDLSVAVISPTADELVFADPTVFPELRYFANLGVNFVVPDGEQDGPWIHLSWEQSGLYPADLALFDVRGGWPNPIVAEGNAIWDEYPAQKAGQIGKWQPQIVLSYQGISTILEELTATIEESRDDIVS